LALLLFVAGVPSQAQETELVPIFQQWAAVEGVWGYRVEVQNEAGKILFAKDVTEPRFETQLPLGNYRLRVSSLNRFGQADSSTAWTDFTVRKIPVPVVQKIVPEPEEENEPFSLVIEATGIDSKTVWQLIAAGSPAVAAISSVSAGGDSWRVFFPGVPRGDYKVQVTGRTGKQGDLPDAIVVTGHSPVLTGTKPDRVEAEAPFTVELLGDYLLQVAKVELSSDKTKAVTGTLVRQEGSSAVLSFPGLDPGIYSLQAISAAGKAVRLPDALQVLMPAPVVQRVTPRGLLKTVTVAGSNWSPGMKAFLSLNGRRKQIGILGQEGKGLTLVYPGDLPLGIYDLILVNNEGKEAVVPGAVEAKALLKIEAFSEEENEPIVITVSAAGLEKSS
jgi:hypothetical protein